MKLNKINISIGIALIGITYLIVNKIQKNNLSKKLYIKINSPEDVTGTGYDLETSAYLQGKYYRDLINQYGYGNVTLLKSDVADAKARRLFELLSAFNVDEEAVLGLFKQFTTKSQISYLAERYQIISKEPVWKKLSRIDDVLFGFGILQPESNLYLPKIKAYIDSLPMGVAKNGVTIK